MSLILEYKDKKLDEESKERIEKLLQIHFSKLFKWADLKDENGNISSKKINEVMKSNKVLKWKTIINNMSNYYLWHLVVNERKMTLYEVVNSLHFMVEDEALTYYRMIEKNYPDLIDDKLYTAKSIELMPYLEKRKFNQVIKFLNFLQSKYKHQLTPLDIK